MYYIFGTEAKSDYFRTAEFATFRLPPPWLLSRIRRTRAISRFKNGRKLCLNLSDDPGKLHDAYRATTAKPVRCAKFRARGTNVSSPLLFGHRTEIRARRLTAIHGRVFYPNPVGITSRRAERLIYTRTTSAHVYTREFRLIAARLSTRLKKKTIFSYSRRALSSRVPRTLVAAHASPVDLRSPEYTGTYLGTIFRGL